MKKPFSKQTQNKDNPTKLENNPNKRGITHFNNSILKTPNTREILFIPNEPENLNLNTNRDRENLIIYKPFEIPPEWPSEEELQEKAELFSDKDNHKIFFPTSLESSFQSKIKWLRPDEYVRNFLIQKEIKINFPNKNQTKMLREIIDYYYTVELLLRKIKTEKEQNFNKNFSSLNSQNKKGETSNLDDSTYTEYKDIILNTVDSEILNGFNDFNSQAYNDISKANIYNNKFDERNIIINEGKESFNVKRNIYKIFFKFFENKPKIFLVNLSERNETVFETKQRQLIIQQEEENNRAELLNKNKKNLNSRISNKSLNQNIYKENNLPTNKNNSQDPIKIKDIDPRDLYFTNDQNIPVFTKWLTSIFQIINDLNLTDAYTNRSILTNIYPQRENIPIISATGRYWVKLYFMGKPRKIEIDDTIPCNRNECYVFPRCDDIGEIWPALFTKALLKLYSYKYSHFYYKEIADLSYIYSLLGYYTEKIPINSPRVKIMENILLNPMEVIDDKILTFSCMNLIEENLKIPIIPNAQEFSKKSFNFNFKILDQEKDSIYNNTNNDTSNILKFSNSINRKFSIKPKTNLNFHDYISNKTTKPKFSSIVKNIFSGYKNKQPRGNSVSKNLLEFPSTGGGQKNIGNTLSSEKNIMQILAAGASQGLNNINSFDKENILREIITNEDRKDTNNIDESEINFNVGEKGKKNDTIDSENPHNNNNISNQNLILNQISENDVIHECNNEHGLNSKILIPDKKNKYIDFVSKLKSFNNIKNKTHKTKSSNDLKLFDFSNTETVFKIQENKPYDVHKLHELLNQRIIKSFARNDNTIKTSTNLVKFDPSMESLGKNDNIKRDDILVNFIYSILEIFDNKKYNMLRLKQVDFSDLKKIVREAQPPGVYKRLSGEEKKIYLSNVLEIKNKQIEYKNQRIEDLKKEGKQFSLIKIKNCCKGIPKFEFYIPYTDYEIFITRKCILNNWALPPPVFYKKEHFLGSEKFEKKEFEEIEINVDENINLEGKKENTNILINLVNNTQNILKSSVFPKKEINKNKLNIGLCKIDEKPECNINNPSLSNINIPFSDNSVLLPNTNRSFLFKKKKNTSYENIHDLLNDKTQYLDTAKEPLSKYTGGQWLNYLDFKKFFNTCIFFYNPKKFKNILILDNNWIYNLDCYEIKQDFSVMYLTYDNINTKSPNASYAVNNTKSSLMLIFEPNNGKSENPIEINFYLNFDLIESSTGIKIQENIKFDEFFSVFYLNNLENDKNYFLMLKSFICPFGFNFTILSDHNVDCMSFNLYMKKFCKYDSQKFELEHKVIEKNKNLLLAKFSLKIEENTRMKVNIYHPDKLLMNYFDVFLVFGLNNKKKIFFNNSEFFSIDPLKEEDLYYMIILANPPFIMNENNFTVEFLYNVENIKIENIEFIEPFKLHDRFSMNKYGIIFKENVTCSELVYTTLDISIKKSLEENLINSNKNLNNFIQHTQQSENKSIYSGDGGGKGNDQETHEKFPEENLLLHNNPYQNDQENFTEKIRMKIKILKNKKILFEEDFFNHILIDNFIFENPYYNSMNFTPDPKNKTTSPLLPEKEAYTYTIICYFEQSELERNREFIVNPFWEIRFFASDFLYFSKDTSKEDFETSIKDSWEVNNPGRSDLAKTSRLRFLVSKKIQEGKKLNKQEEEIIKQERIRKTSYSTEIIFPREKIILNNNSKPKIPANEKKHLNDIQETVNILPKIEKIEFNKPIIIKPEFIKSLYIKNFVNYTLKDRTIVKGNDVSETQRLIRTDNLRQRKIEEINHKFSNYEYYKKTDTEEIDNFNITSTENLKKFYRTTTNFRMYTRDSSNNLFKQRDCLRGKIQQKNEYEKNIIDILLSSNNDLNYCTIIFNETQGLVGISTRLRDKLFNHISVKKDDFYKNEIKKLTVKDKGLASRYLDEINNENWNISADVIHKLQDLVEGETYINTKK